MEGLSLAGPRIVAPIRILLCKFSIFNDFLSSEATNQSIKLKGRERRRGAMITRSNLAEQLREYQIRSKHDWASVSFFSSTVNITSSRVDVVVFVIWELLILAFLGYAKVTGNPSSLQCCLDKECDASKYNCDPLAQPPRAWSFQ
ncbi:hypothetical protein CCACVL1_02634 [Corchorus capsularis]|uniref:Uncharacterized protein n=1 Tax=Corchorus capsularis TaxID=210143 RepID=A0A1R3K7D5_COCAP|nr:hypothetical protein CCACVL1_02634 [Corchorus capsularis]